MLRAELGGGQDAVTIIWQGRTSIPGIEPGRAVAIEGTLALRHGRKVMYNPRYELGDPEQGSPNALIQGPPEAALRAPAR
jgi:hypothetical protein